MGDEESKRKFLSVAQTAEHFSISEKSIRRWIDTNKIKSIDLGRAKRIPKSEIERISIDGISNNPDACLVSSIKKARRISKTGGKWRPWEE